MDPEFLFTEVKPIDEGIALFRSSRDEIRFRFCEMYMAWIEAARANESFNEVQLAWQEYVNARESWLCC